MELQYPCCPVCHAALRQDGRSRRCEHGHCFDLAKEGYCNLLTASHKPGSTTGDNRLMAHARSNFLNKGYFAPLADAVADFTESAGRNGVVLDVCCGEGYYSRCVLARVPCRLFGFDLSKEMVRRAAKQANGGFFFVANLSAIPLPDESVDAAFHLFAPFHEAEFARVLKNGGRLCTVVPGENHLFELKAAVYDRPYKNDARLPETGRLRLIETRTVSAVIRLQSNEDIRNLFAMTPYQYRTSPQDYAKLGRLDTLETQLEFVLGIYQKGAET